MDLSDINQNPLCNVHQEDTPQCCASPCKVCREGTSAISPSVSETNSSNRRTDESLNSNITSKPLGHLARPRTLPMISEVICGNGTPSNTSAIQQDHNHSNVSALGDDAHGDPNHIQNASDLEEYRLVAAHQTHQRNTFGKLAEFFLRPNQAVIVVDLLKDHLIRGLVSPITMVSDLWEYALQLHPLASHKAHLFIHSAFVTLASFAGYEELLTKIVKLMCRPLFADVYNTIFGPSAHNRVSKKLLLEIFLTQGCSGRVMYKTNTKFMDLELGLGERPLISALRYRDVDTTYLLLKYGASTQTKWLAFQQAIEILLFSPHLIFLSDSDMADLRRCLPLVISATPYIDWKHIDDLKNKYCAIDQKWLEQVTSYTQINSPPTLKHVCRATIRKCLDWNLPHGIEQLPIPVVLKHYLHLPSPV